jgi:lipoyl(octanoyl) transferase
MNQSDQVLIKDLGLMDYEPVWQAMKYFALNRKADAADEIWFVQHRPVYTLGLNAHEAPPEAGDIPCIKTDRGGDITYHGPGQYVVYVLMDIQRRGWGIRQLVNAMEQATIDLLADYGIVAERRKGAPGVYVNGNKIASLGLRIKRYCSYHGLSINANMDLEPFHRITPCGLKGMRMTQLADLTDYDPASAQSQLQSHLLRNLGYNPGPETAA